MSMSLFEALQLDTFSIVIFIVHYEVEIALQAIQIRLHLMFARR
jgi:hypothetical protein